MTSFDPMSQRRIPWVSAFSFVFILNFAEAIFAQSTSERFEPELFAFQTGFANADSKAPKDLVRLVDESGFDGVELMGLDQLDEFFSKEFSPSPREAPQRNPQRAHPRAPEQQRCTESTPCIYFNNLS